MQDYKYVDIYLYHPITKEFLYKDTSERNPLDPTTPIIPSCATTDIPPEKQEGFAIVWVGNKWEYKEDHRKEVWYNATTKQLETINFIGQLDKTIYYTPDSAIANPPEGNYWVYDSDTQAWVADIVLYKQYLMSVFPTYWSLKQNTPFEFNGHRYIASWRELYTSIWVTLKDGLKDKYRIQDYDGQTFDVNAEDFKPIVVKISDINDEMFVDKHNLEKYFATVDNYDKLNKKFQEYVNKVYM